MPFCDLPPKCGLSDQGTISLKLLGGKLAPKLVYFALRKELINFSEMAPREAYFCHFFVMHIKSNLKY